MKVLFRGQALALDDSLLLGEGGEARVYRHPSLDLALKIFHDDATVPAKLVQLRAEKLARFPKGLPPNVAAPVEILVDKKGKLVGYAMQRIDSASDIAILANKKSRAGFTNSDVLGLFCALVETVDALHAQGVVVGDMNDGNVLVVRSGGQTAAPRSPSSVFVIDADSMQVGGLPCPVAHERFLDPRLYGKNLLDGPCFDALSDAYALRVLLFQSLLCVHPYGGVHPSLPTLLRRAEAGHSLLRGDVALPRAAIVPDTLPDDLLHDFARCFDDGARVPLDTRLLSSTFRVCTCGVEHARATCPACKTVVQAPAVRTSGGVTEETVLETRGLVLLARDLNGHLAFLVEEDGRVRREDHGTVLAGARPQGMRFAIAGDATWVGHEGQLVKVRGEQVVDSARTGLARGVMSFAAGRGGLFVVEGDALVHHETRARIGRVFESQTLLLPSDDGGLGVYRAGRLLMGFMFRQGALFDAALAQPRGKLVDLDVTLDAADGRCLVGMAFDDAGKRFHALTLLDATGKRLAHVEGEPESTPVLNNIRGKLLVRGRALSASAEGIVAIDVDAKSGLLHAGALFADTRPFVDDTVELLPGSGGTLLVVSPKAITRLRLKGSRT
jgi:hypothetical protein